MLSALCGTRYMIPFPANFRLKGPLKGPLRTCNDRRGTPLRGVPREQKMLKGHLPRVIYHQVY